MDQLSDVSVEDLSGWALLLVEEDKVLSDVASHAPLAEEMNALSELSFHAVAKLSVKSGDQDSWLSLSHLHKLPPHPFVVLIIQPIQKSKGDRCYFVLVGHNLESYQQISMLIRSFRIVKDDNV